MTTPEIDDEVRKHYAIVGDIAAARAHRAAVVESSPEVAALRELLAITRDTVSQWHGPGASSAYRSELFASIDAALGGAT